MAAVFHFGLRRAEPWPEENRLGDIRWGLSGVDPHARLRCGVFPASDGANVAYRFWRAAEPKAAILLLHGACDYSGAFDEIAPQLAQHGFTCLAYDQRGFGASASRGEWAGTERLVNDVGNAIAFLRERIGHELPLFIAGESMGGAVAVHAAAKFAGLRIAGLVLVAPGALASAVRRIAYGWMARAVRAWARESEVVFERVSGWELTPAAAIRLMSDPLVMRSIRPEIFTGLVALGSGAVKKARKINVPVLTLVAGKDDLLRQPCIRRLHDNLAGEKRWMVVKDAPHLLLHWKHGETVLREVRRWMTHRLAPVSTRASASADCAPGRTGGAAFHPHPPIPRPA
ncbi:MAG TPA: alpha/beta fold hydrolase [Rhizomicrobium sp.]|jgi:alpha-beta hydrolase superfamily lysophospholipase|nr:alpha/beta fold hydrolase [Rhizomicrobium sp.]